jgi:response regulator RpfG family c-di-GMP phosphodiesterase/tRNA A-37 threonylcarbamoyl transferase component Bud32
VIPQRIGRYEVQGELGRGGMAVVYRGLDPVIKRPTALKVLRKADLDAAEAAPILERFKREAQAAGSLHHPNIVAIYEYGEDAEYEWIAMELVEGRSLRDHLRAGWRPDLSRLPSVLEQLLEALDYSHGRGVIHRDVKPGNVLVSDMGMAKMSDFGIARIERSHMTQEGELLGTPYYMAPEQYEGKPVDERTDIYSAGVIVYEVLTGRRPFDGQGGHLMHQILTAPPPPASTWEPRLPVTIDMVLARALAKKPANRPKGAREFLDALRHAFPGTAVQVPERTQPMAAAVPASQPVPEPRKGGIAGNVGALRKALGATPPPAAAEKKEIARPALRRPSVLFVDDEERVLNALASVFNDQYEVETFTGGRAALERLKQRRFHVLVSDQRMPEMVGVELLREAKTLAPGTVRLLLTGYSDLAAIVGSVNESEVFRFVSKPWQEEDLKATLAEAVDVAIALEVAALAPAPAIPGDSTVLVMGEPALARGVRELAKSAYQVREAPGMDAALELLAAEEVAVLVCDIDGAGDPAALLRVLKEQSPRTQLIAVSAAADSEQVIGLINEARIVRFLAKPVNLSLLQSALGAALQRAARVRKTPEWLRSEAAKKRREASAAERSLLGRLKGLGGRFAAVLRG